MVDLDAARTGRPAHGDAIATIIAAVGERLSVEVAGGLRTDEAVATALERGAARAVLGTAAIRDPAFAGVMVEVHGAARIAVAIDVRGAGPSATRGRPPTPASMPRTSIRSLADAGVETFEVTAIERDGLLGGPDLGLYERLVRLDRGAIIASGGIATVDDIRAVRAVGCRGAIIGRALYEGRLPCATRWTRRVDDGRRRTRAQRLDDDAEGPCEDTHRKRSNRRDS